MFRFAQTYWEDLWSTEVSWNSEVEAQGNYLDNSRGNQVPAHNEWNLSVKIEIYYCIFTDTQ